MTLIELLVQNIHVHVARHCGVGVLKFCQCLAKSEVGVKIMKPFLPTHENYFLQMIIAPL